MSPAQELAKQRWTRPDVVQARVDSLARAIEVKLSRLPPLTDEQKRFLTAVING